jgi:hypothetical protein
MLRQCRFADPTRPGDRQQPRLVQQLGDQIQIGIAPDDRLEVRMSWHHIDATHLAFYTVLA